MRVVEVQAGSPGPAGGLRPGDVIVGLDRTWLPASTTSLAFWTARASTSALRCASCAMVHFQCRCHSH